MTIGTGGGAPGDSADFLVMVAAISGTPIWMRRAIQVPYTSPEIRVIGIDINTPYTMVWARSPPMSCAAAAGAGCGGTRECVMVSAAAIGRP